MTPIKRRNRQKLKYTYRIFALKFPVIIVLCQKLMT